MDDSKTKRPLSHRERDRVRASNNLLTRARALRREGSDAENVLWRHLRARRLMGYKFRRQMVIRPYIVDFVCLEVGLIIEADGCQHSYKVVYDARRTAMFEGMGYRVMRYWTHEILRELETVLEKIRAALMETPSPQPSPKGRGS